MGAVDFLREKRKRSGKSTDYEMKAVAPSARKRYGTDSMGGYNNQSGRYTGAGPDGIVQPSLPTQRRIDTNGKPYMVDEGELLVIDAKTLEDFGGAEALDSFIQQNRPQRGGADYQMKCGGKVPKYEHGGIPGRPRVFNPAQFQLLDDVKKGIDQYQLGGTPNRRRTIEQITQTGPGGRVRPDIPGGKIPGGGIPSLNIPGGIPGGKSTGNVPFDAKRYNFPSRRPQTPQVNPTKPPVGGVDPISLNPVDIPNISRPLPVQSTPFQNLNIPSQGVPNISKQVDPLQLQDVDIPNIPGKQPPVTQPTGTPTLSPSELDEMRLNRYVSRQGAMSEAERAAEAQRGLQGGLSEREVMGRGAISDVSRREALGETVSQFAMDAAQRAEARDRFQQEMGLRERGMSIQERQMELQVQSQGFDQAMTQAMLGIKAGDYRGVNKILTDMGLNPIDFNKIQSIEDANNIVGGIDNIINGLGPDADPKLLGFLGSLKGQVYANSWKNMGVDPRTMTFTDDQGNQISINDFVNSIDNPDDPNPDPDTVSSMLKIGKNMKTWLDETPAGEIFVSQLELNDNGKELMDKVMAGDEASAGTLGQLVGAAFAQDMGVKLTGSQKDILKEYDLYDEGGDITTPTPEEIAPKVADIEKAITEGDFDKAQDLYDALTPEEQKVAVGLNEKIKTAREDKEKINSFTKGDYWYNAENIPTDTNDPIYQELLTHATTVQFEQDQKYWTGGGNNQYYFESLGAKADHIGMKIKKGDLINHDGKLLIFKKVALKTTVGTDENYYTFYDPVTKKEVIIKAGK